MCSSQYPRTIGSRKQHVNKPQFLVALETAIRTKMIESAIALSAQPLRIKTGASHFCRNIIFLWGGHPARPIPIAGETAAPPLEPLCCGVLNTLGIVR
jgi:hypothetical protein